MRLRVNEIEKLKVSISAELKARLGLDVKQVVEKYWKRINFELVYI